MVCVTVCSTRSRSALLRVDRVDMCPDHKVQTCIQVSNLCLTAQGAECSGNALKIKLVIRVIDIIKLL